MPDRPSSTVRSRFPQIDLHNRPSMYQRLQAMSVAISGICEAVPSVPDEDLLFQKKDIAAVSNPIAKLFRMIIYNKRMTESEFFERHRRYKESIGKTLAQINTDKGNLKKTIWMPRLTIQQFEATMSILNYDLVDMVFSLSDRTTGEVKEYRLSDVYQYRNDTTEEIDYLFDRGLNSDD